MAEAEKPSGQRGPTVVSLPEEIDVVSGPAAAAKLSEAISAGATIIIADLTHTTFVDSSGHACCIRHTAKPPLPALSCGWPPPGLRCSGCWNSCDSTRCCPSFQRPLRLSRRLLRRRRPSGYPAEAVDLTRRQVHDHPRSTGQPNADASSPPELWRGAVNCRRLRLYGCAAQQACPKADDGSRR